MDSWCLKTIFTHRPVLTWPEAFWMELGHNIFIVKSKEDVHMSFKGTKFR